MPSPRKRSQKKKLREREDLIRRSPVLDNGAKILWIELERGWAWNDRSCCPGQDTLALALGWTPRRVRRHLSTLVELGLVEIKKRVGRSNEYVLPDRIPKRICDPSRLINKNLAKDLDEDDSMRTKTSSHEDKNVHSMRTKSSSPLGQKRPLDEDEIVLSVRTKSSYEDELIGDELIGDELLELRGTPTSRFQTTEKKSKKILPKGSESEEVSRLLGETVEDLPSKRKRKEKSPRTRRGCDNLFVPGAGEMHSHTPEGVRVVSAAPPLPTKAQDLLDLFADEILAKYGKAAYLTMDLKLTKAEEKKLEHGILEKYDARVVISMIRLLVWDWEVIREECWPKNSNVMYPRLEHLLRYKLPLASNVPTGFDYRGKIRGSSTSYAQRYLTQGKIVNDPFS